MQIKTEKPAKAHRAHVTQCSRVS